MFPPSRSLSVTQQVITHNREVIQIRTTTVKVYVIIRLLYLP